MLSLPRQKFDKFKRLLLRRQREVEDELTRVSKDDPVYSDALAESTEPGTDSWVADVHSKAQALKANLQQILQWIKESLTKLKDGKYGKCEKCGSEIELERLEAMPTAKLCVSCSKKTSKK